MRFLQDPVCSWSHPPFKATRTGARRTRLGNYDFCPTLAETKRKNIILDHMNSRICLGSSQYWLHKFVQITTKTAPLVIFWQPWLAAGTNTAWYVAPSLNQIKKGMKYLQNCIKCTNWVIFGSPFVQKSAFFYATIMKVHFFQLEVPKSTWLHLAHILR